MENIDGFSVERIGDEIHIAFYDLFGQGEVYILSMQDARKVFEALDQYLGPYGE